jgi:metal-responsive CopG/Arc/MetJ family transcriptional regulator
LRATRKTPSIQFIPSLIEVRVFLLKIDKNVWEEFERLCSNSQFSKRQIITQALKDFMKEYKHLL